MSPFTFNAHPETWVVIVALLGGYLYALSAWGPTLAPGRRPATRSQRLCFYLGIAALWVAGDYPVHDLAEGWLFSVHMVQHTAFQLVAAPLLLLGTPGWLLRKLLSPRWLFSTVRVITRPLPALLLMNGYIAVSHVPAFVNLTVHNGLFHFFAHVLLMAFALVMWWPVVSPLPELPHLSYPGRMAYLFGHSIIPTVPASFLTFAGAPLYSAYVELPRIWAWLDPVQDQQIAGLLMKIGGGLLLWAVIAALFFRWAHEEQTGGPDLLYWRDLRAGLDTPTAPSPPSRLRKR
jgi:putative membrane protein